MGLNRVPDGEVCDAEWSTAAPPSGRLFRLGGRGRRGLHDHPGGGDAARMAARCARHGGRAIVLAAVVLTGPSADRAAAFATGDRRAAPAVRHRLAAQGSPAGGGRDPAARRGRDLRRETAELRRRHERQKTSHDWIAGIAAFKAVLLEGLEVVFIVIAVGAGRGLIWPASLGALAACAWSWRSARRCTGRWRRVPENTLKFGVGVMLSAFGVFWTGEGLGVDWPGRIWRCSSSRRCSWARAAGRAGGAAAIEGVGAMNILKDVLCRTVRHVCRRCSADGRHSGVSRDHCVADRRDPPSRSCRGRGLAGWLHRGPFFSASSGRRRAGHRRASRVDRVAFIRPVQASRRSRVASAC